MMCKIVTLRSNDKLLEVLGVFRTAEKARWFVEDNYIEFHKDDCQYSKFESELFIKIESIKLN